MMHQSACGCERFDCPADAGDFYVSARRDGREHVLLLGPFPTHEAALAAQSLGESLAYKTDPKAPWYAYGTARSDEASSRSRVLFIPCATCGEIHFYRANCPCKGGK